MIRITALFAFVLATGVLATGAGGAMAAEDGGAAIDHQRQYRACMALVQRNPEEAFESALSWRDLGGGDASEHCIAAALMGLKQYAEAARRFEQLAQGIKAKAGFKAKLLGHAAQAWIMDGKPGQAENVLTAALALKPFDTELLIDRAQARAGQGLYREAIADLDPVIEREPGRADAYVFRASARRFLDDLDAALADADAALTLAPRHAEGLLERGIIRRLRDDTDGARADWLELLRQWPGTAAAEAAQSNIEKLDVKAKPEK